MKNQILLIGLAFFSAGITSCDKHDEGELITTVKLVFTPTGGGSSETFIWRDIDGPGGNSPDRTDTIRLNDSSSYSVEASFLNESEGKNEDITAEIRNEAKEHIVCYSGIPAANLVLSYDDNDGKYPIGLKTKWESKGSGNGILRINLRHQPKSKDGSCEAGESDVDVSMNVEIISK